MQTRLSSKGRIVLPKAIRDILNWSFGVELTVEQKDDTVVLRRKVAIPANDDR